MVLLWYYLTKNNNYSLLTVRISLNSVLIFPTSFDSATVSDLNGRTGSLKFENNSVKLSVILPHSLTLQSLESPIRILLITMIIRQVIISPGFTNEY